MCLYHYRARAYDAQTGKFLQEDPLLFGGGDFNTFAYVSQNPLSFNDPYGLTANETAGTNSNATRTASAQASIGQRLACIFEGAAAVLEVIDGPGARYRKIKIDNCGAASLKNNV